MLQKVENDLTFAKKRNYKLITPCCNKSNKDGQFVNYIGFPEIYGYCHSCGNTILPPVIYRNENGEDFQWNTTTGKFEPIVIQMSHKAVIQSCNTSLKDHTEKIQYVDFKYVELLYSNPIENNLLKYLRTKYSNKKVNNAKKIYYIGTDKESFAVFWNINKDGKVQKAKCVKYTDNGKRTSYFKAPYLNEDGYYSCLFGEHLLKNNSKPIILVESEKTAVVSSIEFPQSTWLAYSGINGLTEGKMKVLSGESITIIPDISSKAVNIMRGKMPLFKQYNIRAKIFDMTSGLSDKQLRNEGWYNGDIEDVFRQSSKNENI